MQKIAIIGLSSLFPDAKNPEEFWHNLINKKDATSSATIAEIGVDPTIFYNPVKGTADKTYSLKGGYIRDFEFDASEYNLPSELLAGLDDTFKWSLYAAKQAIKNSGYWGNQNLLAKCGVILGNLSFPTRLSHQLFSPIYRQAIAPAVKELLQHENFNLATLPIATKASVYNAMISGLPASIVAQALSLSRINLCLDAACSSSFYAIKLASHYLSSHKADMMLAGAISCADSLFVRMLFSGVQGFAEDGTSRPLDKTSRGLIPGDGVGMVVLKRYTDAVRDGDHILATICGNGLSNDGKGKHLLSPNTKGQVLAFERAYKEAQISPQSIDYLECHATGTLLGDTTELNSIATFFGQHQASPLVGSAKANVGHLLTAAGMVGLTKVILSMSQNLIPPTINVDVPLASDNNVISSDNIVRKATAWPNNNTPIKRAAISAFGFGGTNSHLILEQGNTALDINSDVPVEQAKVAIVGMDAFFGGCNGLDAFERSIYEGKQHFIPLPPSRWQGLDEQTDLLQEYGLQDGKPPIGAYIQDFDIDTLACKVPPNEVEKLNPQQLLLLKVANRAVEDAGLKEGGNVAVIVAAETELSVHQLQQRWDLSWQVKEGLLEDNISLPDAELSQLESIVKDSIHHPVETSEYVSHIANIMAGRISALWNFTGPAFTMTAGENSALKALEVAQMLLASGEVEAVVLGAIDLAGGVENVLLRSQLAKINQGINTLSFDENADGWMVGEGAGAVVLKRHDTAQQENHKIYAVLDAVSFAAAANDACQQAFNIAKIQPQEINYVEVFGSGIPQQDEAEINGLLQAYPQTGNGLQCAIGSVKANIGHTYTASGIASLIKTALCLYYRYIPATPKWSGAKTPQKWSGSPFYVATESRPWFVDKGGTRRIAAINGIGIDDTYAHVILSEDPDQEERDSRYLQQMPFHLFPVAAENQNNLQEVLNSLEKTIEDSSCLSTTASQTFTTFKDHSESKYALTITGRNKKEILKQIDAARKGVNTAFEKGTDWLTPLGSYFTAKPLGKTASVAYVYPAAVNSYIGIGRTVFRLFPKVFEDLKSNNLYNRAADVEKLVYPRSFPKLASRQLETLEKELLDDSLGMFESEIAFARYMTAIFRDDFQVKPKCVFGYSLGETSMMVAQGVWSDFEGGSNTLNSSPLFGDKLSGAKNAVRQYWDLTNSTELQDDNFWATYVLMATPSQVEECLKHESRVYLTQINTPEEVLIAGEKTACQRVIKTLGCNSFPAPFDHVIHCETMRSEYEEIAKVNSLPTQELPDITFYSAAEYQPIKLDRDVIAKSIATGLCQQLDFPQLVNRVYDDGVKIFVEAGAGGVCSRWISKILENKEHITVSLNRRGMDDHTSMVKALAKLVSHRVNLDLSPLYNLSTATTKQNKLTLRTITLGGKSIAGAILSEENRKYFQNIAKNLNSYRVEKLHQNIPLSGELDIINYPTQPAEDPTKNIMEHGFEIPEELQSSESTVLAQKTLQPIVSSPATNHQLDNTIRMLELNKTQYQKLSDNNYRITQNHAAFLQARKDFSKQMSEIIQLQLVCAENLLNEQT
ncbi:MULTISPECIES: PfaB family protein [Cyanophyceae]|uniref:PfaB family protein n=1 Tax=Cyanophyceae TaxID=3028117 RepID=UPI00232DB18E|nr:MULTISPECIES: PfaB family protein [Cyanophyceae]MDB9356364.1 PfaB family protein [Nodularia spumigena CS-587/03]MDB9337779.1 PfaB family protein [Nodularia spumigena CS-589/07]MDB9347346.1 PfaB family protein [Nodularia spumigena CS-588/01]MDB9352615.1 PfaB family protein [Nodularia spumigena CS-588/05]MDB9401052.1 PfaB family protein [Microcystis aeruginosa CS-567/02-A1]